MLGFSLLHVVPGLAILGAVFCIGDAIWWILVATIGILGRVRYAWKHRAALAGIGAMLACPFVPYGVWQGLTASVVGPSPFSNDIFVDLAAQGDIQGMKTLLSKGLVVNTLDRNGCSALVAAATADRAAIVELLVRRGATINLAACGWDTALHRAALHRDETTVRALLVFLVIDDINGPTGEHDIDQLWHLGSLAARSKLVLPDTAELLKSWRSTTFGEKHSSPGPGSRALQTAGAPGSPD
jgi:ankyrin repeat protein